MKKQDRDNCPPWPAAGTVENTASGRYQKPQIPNRLYKAFDIAPGIEFREDVTVERSSIPLHRKGAIAVFGFF